MVFEVTTKGQLNPSARIEVDGKAVERWTQGEPLRIDIGQHRIEVTADPYPRATQTVLLAEGMRFKLVSIELQPESPKPTATVALRTSAFGSQPKDVRRPIPVLVYPLLGLSAVAFGTFTAFTLSGNGEYDRLAKSCAPFCNDQDVNGVRQRYLFANLSFGVAALALAGAGTIYLTRPAQPSAPAVGLLATRGGAVATIAVAGY